MKHGILKDLYFGNISPYDNGNVLSPEAQKYQKVIGELESQLSRSLANSDLDLFENLCNSQSGFNAQTATDSFLYGFRLGALMMIDLFDEADSMVEK